MLWIFYVFEDSICFDNITRMCDDNRSYCFPRIIWTFWDSKDLPEDIEEMICVSRESLLNFTFNLLVPSNISNYLNVETFPEYFGSLPPANKADYIRISLLEKIGGIWIDVMYVNSGLEMEWVFFEAFKAKCQFVGFDPPSRTWEIVVSFIGGPENSIFLKKYKSEYDDALGLKVELYVRNVCKDLRLKFKKLRAVRCREYHLLDLIFGKIVFEDRNMNKTVLYLPTYRSHIWLALKCRGRVKCIKDRMINEPNITNVPFVKLTHVERSGSKMNLKEKKSELIKVDVYG